MPSISLQIHPNGPLIDVHIGLSGAREQALQRAGQPVAAPMPVRLLIDTGASCTSLDQTVISGLGLTPTGQIPVHTPSTDGTPKLHNQYDIKLVIPHTTISRVFDPISIMEANFAPQGIQGLLGRDILRSCMLVYNGDIGFFTLAF